MDDNTNTRASSAQNSARNSHEEQICRKWNRGECFKSSGCSYYHECLKCGGTHPRIQCPMFGENASGVNPNDGPGDANLPEPCIKWNYRDCTWAEKCYRRHECLHCHEKHRILDCPENPPLQDGEYGEPSDEVCMNWNHGRCRMGDKCKRIHACSQCSSRRHPVTECTEPERKETEDQEDADASNMDPSEVGDTDGEYSEEVCLNWNNGRCKLSRSQCRRAHVCSVCGESNHAAISCNLSDITPRDLVEAGVEICLNWNNGRCTDCTVSNSGVGSNCKRVHICSVCKRSTHPAVRCDWDAAAAEKEASLSASTVGAAVDAKTSRSLGTVSLAAEICMNWNNNRCRLGSERCKRIHACYVCRSRDHTAAVCPNAPASDVASIDPDDVCLNWNQGRCRLGKKCKREHVCSLCFRDTHTSRDCVDAH